MDSLVVFTPIVVGESGGDACFRNAYEFVDSKRLARNSVNIDDVLLHENGVILHFPLGWFRMVVALAVLLWLLLVVLK
jgi:hypothetical protein